MIGKKNADKSLEAFVEFATVEEAKKAQENLDGADIYSGCCSLTVTFSKLKVNVTKNDTESWDFSDSTPSKEGLLSSASGQRTLLGSNANGGGNAHPPESSATVTQISAPAQISAPPTVSNPPVAYPPQSYYGYSAQQPVPTPYMPAGYYCSTPMMPGQPMPGFASPAGPYGMPMHSPYYQHPAAGYPGYPQGYMSGGQIPTQHSTARSAPQILPTPPPVHHVTPAGIGIGHSTSNLNSTSVAAARNTDMSIFHAEEGAVLMACNLPEGVNCDHLFNVLCLYGNIARIKFLKSRPGCAMIQMGSKESADRVSEHLNGATVFGQVIEFHHSKQTEVQEHAGLGTLSDGSPVMKNYMTDSNNRFRNPIVAAKSRILAPTRTLHFFNAPLNFSPEDMCRVFADCGVKRPPRIVVFTAKPGQKTSLGLAEWDTVPDALDALSLSNHRPIHIVGFAHPFHLKLAFSPKPISDDRAGACMIKYPAPPMHHKDAVISRKPSYNTVAAPDVSGYGFQPHTIVTVASPSLQSTHLHAASDSDKPAEIGTAMTPQTQSHDSRDDGDPASNDVPTASTTFSVDELEAAEAAYLASLTAAAANEGLEESSKSEHEEKVDGEQRDPVAPSLEQADVEARQPSPTLESDSEDPSPRPVRRQPTTPPSEPEDDE
uniref:RRM domain-containing protein n=1 Tax=Schistocephalus solidus TaxID=70667 RepID=A0A0V0J481_SCHSO